VIRVPLSRDEAVDAIRKDSVDAVLDVAPLAGKSLANFNAAVERAFRDVPIFIEIDADAVAKSLRAYESEKFLRARGRPRHCRRKTLQLIYESRQPVIAQYPTADLIEAASADKDALIPIHPRAEAFYDNSEKTFFDRYGDASFYGPMFLSLFGTAGIVLFRYLTRHQRQSITDALERLRQIGSEATTANSDHLKLLESNLNDVFDAFVTKLSRGGLAESEITSVLLVLKHVSDVLSARWHELVAGTCSSARAAGHQGW
jgi:hypothetical protein